MRFGLGHIQRGNGVLEPGALTYIDALSVTPSNDYQTKINQLFIDLDAAGLLAKLDALWIAVNPNKDHGDSLINVINPGVFNLTAIGSSPASQYSGALGRWNATGSDGYDTNYGVGDGLATATDFCMFVRNRHSSTTSTGLDMGTYDGSTFAAFITRRSTLEMRGSIGSAAVGNHLVVGANGGVLNALQRDGSNSLKCYRDGNLQFTGSIGYTNVPTTNIHLLGYNNNGSHARNVCPQYYAGLGRALSDAEHASLFSILEAYCESYVGVDSFSNTMNFSDSWLYTTTGSQNIALPKHGAGLLVEVQGGGGGGGGASDGAANGTGGGIAGNSSTFVKPTGGTITALGANGGSPCFPTGTPSAPSGAGGSGGDATYNGIGGGIFYRGAAGSIGSSKGFGGGANATSQSRGVGGANTADKAAPGTGASVVGVAGNIYGGGGQAGARNTGGTVYCGSGGAGGGFVEYGIDLVDHDFEELCAAVIGTGGNGQTPTVGNAIAGGAGRQGAIRIAWSF